MATVSDHKTLDCPLCFKTFTTPRVLPCSHTFCEKCLVSSFDSQQKIESTFLCPFCTTPITPVQPNIAIDKWVSAFPLNNLICSILESAEVSGKSDENNHCDPCKADGEINKAEFWCKDCQEKICSLCRKLHNRNKLLKHHTTVPIEEMDQHLECNINFDQECGRHREKVKLFCADHRELCCAVCVATDHRQCNDVRTIEDMAHDQSQPSASDCHSITRDLANLKTEMEKIISDQKSNAKQILQEKDKIIHDTDNRIGRITERLNKLKNAFKKETDQLYKDTEILMHENEKSVKHFTKNIENCSEVLDFAERNGTQQQKFMTIENIRHQISSHYHQLKSKLSERVEVHFNMKENTVLNHLEKTLNSVGTVEISTDSSTATRDVLLDTDEILKNLNFRTKVSTGMRAAQVEKRDLMSSPATFVKAVMREKIGSGTFFTGGTYTADGRLVMADRNNNRLVELDAECNMVKEYKIDGPPTDVAAGNNNNEIYVAVNENYIYKCTLGQVHSYLAIVSRIKAPSDTWGIAVSGDNIVVGTPGAVVIFRLDGSTVRSIPKSGVYNSYVAVSQTQRTIFHSDNDDVVCRTWEGQEVFRYRHQELQTPLGIDIDSDGNVYVCCYMSHNLHQVSSNGQRSRILKLHNISSPRSVVVHPQKKELVVTSRNEETVCEVYKLG